MTDKQALQDKDDRNRILSKHEKRYSFVVYFLVCPAC